MKTRVRSKPNRIHSTVTHVTENGWAWACEDCPAKADGYATKTKALRVAVIHEDPARKPTKTHH